jgi:Tfp pilus assembly protein PilO
MRIDKKNMILLAGFFLTLILGYHLSISKTFDAREKFLELQGQVSMQSRITSEMAYLKQQNEYYEKELEKNQISIGSSFQSNLLKIINSFASTNSLQITGFHEPHVFIQQESITKTYRFSVKGDFSTILRLVHSIEQFGNYGNIVSMDFKKKKNYKSNKEYLECGLLLQRKERSQPH